MPYDLTRTWQDSRSDASTESCCQRCPNRSVGLCALLQADGLTGLVTRRVYQRRTMIRHEREPLRHVLVFRSGVASVARSFSGGRRQVLNFLMAGDCLGLANEASMPLCVSVLEEAEVCRIPIEALLDHRRSPTFLRGLIRLIGAATERVHDHVVLLGRMSAEQRVIAFLLRYRAASQRVQGRKARIDLPMTRRDIADHLALAPETICRVLSWLQGRQMIVQIPDGIRILDLKSLDRLSVQDACEEEPAVQASGRARPALPCLLSA